MCGVAQYLADAHGLFSVDGGLLEFDRSSGVVRLDAPILRGEITFRRVRRIFLTGDALVALCAVLLLAFPGEGTIS